MVMIKPFETSRGYRAFQKKQNNENAKWAFVELYEAERTIPADLMKFVYEILKKQVGDYHEQHPPVQGYDYWKWSRLFDDIEGTAEELSETQEVILKRYAENWSIVDSAQETPAWQILRDRYKRKFRGKK